jgi:glycosyltransferase involved in cell wall biosynthesis
VLRVIARLNVGGPAHHVSLLSGRLDAERYESLLVAGTIGHGEASFDDLVEHYGARLLTTPELGPELAPGRDGRALLALASIMHRFRPDIVHTHTAKAGTLGRLAARMALGTRAVVVHTYHGHVLKGYFGPARTEIYREIERGLALMSDCLVGVSEAVVRDLVSLHVAPFAKFRTIRLGLELDEFFHVTPEAGAPLRRELHVQDGEILAVFVGRLVPIKRVDLLLKAVVAARAQGARIRLAIVGDGELRRYLEEFSNALGLDGIVSFLGFRRDLPSIAAATDVAVLSSANEGTPVALIEAAAAGRPAVATAVGGVADIVTPATGRLVSPDGAEGLAAALVELAAGHDLRRVLGEAARRHVRSTYTADRLVADVDDLYRELLAERAG